MSSHLLLVQHSESGNEPSLKSLVSSAIKSNSIEHPDTNYYRGVPGGFKNIGPEFAIIFHEDAKARPTETNVSSDPASQDVPSQGTKRPSSPTSEAPAAKKSSKAADDAHQQQETAVTSEADIVTWTDDDVDATDYKNMPDYDLDQEESVYESTPEPDAGPASSKTSSTVGKYEKIYDSDASTSRNEPRGLATHLLLLFIPTSPPLSSPASSPTSSLSSTTSPHATFLHHIQIYPFMTSLDSYLHTSAFASKESYLIVQTFSSLEKRSEGWFELKRKEAKHWWRKEERGARGVRVGLFQKESEGDG